MSNFVDEPKKNKEKIRRMKQFIKKIWSFDRIFRLFATNFWKYVDTHRK